MTVWRVHVQSECRRYNCQSVGSTLSEAPGPTYVHMYASKVRRPGPIWDPLLHRGTDHLCLYSIGLANPPPVAWAPPRPTVLPMWLPVPEGYSGIE